jgi:hypothetical protein
MVAQKRYEVLFTRLEQDGKVAAIYNATAKGSGFTNEVFEVGMKLRGSAGEVEGGDVGLAKNCEHVINRTAAHNLGPARTGLNVAMAAGLITAATKIGLEHLDGLRKQGPLASLLKLDFACIG